MKKTVILPESLLERAFPALLTVITNGNQNNNHFILFKYIKEIARITNTTNNLNKVIDLLNKTETSYEYVEEANIDEYFFSHTDEPELYLTPTDSSSQVISSAALLKFKGTLLIYDMNKDAPTPRNCNSYINVFSLNQHAGGKSLNKASAEHHHITGSCCTFTIDGKTYKETIKGRSKSAHQGVEGFTQTSECNPNYKLKIWDSPNKKQFEIDKLRNMIALKNKHPEIAFPLAFVYNDQNNIIGFVMKNFSGTNTSFADIHKLKNPAIYVKQLLEQLIFLEVNGFLHRDVHHNILIDTKKQTLNIIDIDSIQFKAYPATALSFDRENAAPEIYQSDSLFFNTIEISYSAMCALIAVFTEPKSIFGLYDDKGFVEVDSKALSEIKSVAPQIENLVRVSHRTGKPVALVRQLHELCALTANNTPNTIVVDETTHPTTKPTQKDRVIVTPSKVTSCDKHYPKETPNYFKKFKLWAMEKIIDKYMPGTVIEGQSIEELFKIFIKTGLWKKPLAGTSLTILTIVVLLIAIIQLY